MSRLTENENMAPDGQPEDPELRRKKPKHQKGKSKRIRTIRKGIETYFERKKLKKQLSNDFDEEDLDDLDDLDDLNDLNDLDDDESWYH